VTSDPVTNDLQAAPAAAAALCRAAHDRLLATARTLGDTDLRRPSRLPDWSLGHVLTHLARNAEGHTRRLEGALRGEAVPRYPGGTEQRDGEIADGATRPVSAVVDDLEAASRTLEEIWERSEAAGWPSSELMAGDFWPTDASPAHRLREVEMHHVDLGAGYEPSDWPQAYVDWELPSLLAYLHERIPRPGDRRDLVAWLSGRGPAAPGVAIDPW
jgi:maleylpyruvate isomerase